METNNKITDELIAKYINGTTTEEEENLIHDYLAQNPEFANDLLDIATALRHQHKQDEGAHMGQEEQSKEAKRILFMPLRTFYTVAASVVLLIGIGLLVFLPSKHIGEGQPEIAVVSPETNVIATDTIDDEGNEMGADLILSVEPEAPLVAENQESNGQPTENVSEPQNEQPLLADDNLPQHQQEIESPTIDPDVPVMAAQTIYQDDSGIPLREDAVFVTDNIPTVWNPNKALVLKWDCNAPEVAIEFSIDGGRTWKSRFINPRNNQIELPITKLNDFELDNPEGFRWRITAQYRDGTLSKEGFIRFSSENN